MKRKEVKKQNIIQLFMVLSIIVLVGFVSSFVFMRFDLTAEKRYTLAESTIDFLEKLDDVCYFQIYLNGDDLPYGFKRLQNSTREILNEFRNYAGSNIQYEFIDPFESPDLKTRGEIGRQLMKKGLVPTSIEVRDDNGGVSEKLIFSGTILTYREKEMPLELLKNNASVQGEQNLNNSIQSLEYELVNAIRKLEIIEKQKIAFIQGHGELSGYELEDIKEALSEFYSIDTVTINGKLNSLLGYSCIIIAKPDTLFSEKDKYIIDQFIMKGGKSLWFIDAVDASMQQLSFASSSVALVKQTNIEDQLFRYGVRVNSNIIQDMQCGGLKIKTSPQGAALKFTLFPWIYFPLLTSNNEHSITKNIDLVRSEFVSMVDTVGTNSNVEKTFLLYSSNKSRVVNAPIQFSLKQINEPIDKQYFPKAYLPVAVLMEGSFESVFKNRSEISGIDELNFRETSKPTAMIVVGDGDIIKNQIHRVRGDLQSFPLGYDRHTDMTFAGNKTFILNSVNYLLDDAGLMGVRSRELKLRLLDPALIRDDRTKWQLINTLVPLIFILIFGISLSFYRRKKYSA